jgi:hypothetical protein
MPLLSRCCQAEKKHSEIFCPRCKMPTVFSRIQPEEPVPVYMIQREETLRDMSKIDVILYAFELVEVSNS